MLAQRGGGRGSPVSERGRRPAAGLSLDTYTMEEDHMTWLDIVIAVVIAIFI